MRIGLLVPGFSADESDWCIPALRDLVAEMAEHEDLHVFALRYPYAAGRYDLFGAGVTAIGGGTRQGVESGSVWSRTLNALSSEHRQRRFDLLHAFWGGETGALAAVAGRLLGIPVVVSLAGGELVGLGQIRYGGRLAPTERLKTWLAMRLAARVTVGSAYLLSLASVHAGESARKKLRRIPLGVDANAFVPDPGVSEESPPRLVQVASLVPVKDQATLLRSTAILRDKGCDFRLEIVGTGPLDSRLRSLSAELGLEGFATFRGEICHDRLPSFYPGAAAYVQSSLHEAQGMALLEAAACGVPLVGTRVGTLGELEPDAATGCAPGDAEGLASAIAELLQNPARRAAMGEAALNLAETEYSLERCIERFRGIYAELS